MAEKSTREKLGLRVKGLGTEKEKKGRKDFMLNKGEPRVRKAQVNPSVHQKKGDAMKMMRCIFEFSRIADEHEFSIKDILGRVVYLLPPACQFPENAIGRIRFHNCVFETADFSTCVTRLSSKLRSKDEVVGEIELGYSDDFPPDQEGPFLREERELLNFLAERLGHIIDRKQAEESIRLSEALHRTVVGTIPDLVWLKDPDGVYLSCNPTFERFYGVKLPDILGRTDYDFTEKELADFFREHDRKAIAAGGPSANEEWLTFAVDGYHGMFETIKTPMYGENGNLIGVMGIARDITGRKKAEEALRESEKQYRLLADNTLDIIWAMNMDLEFTYVNPAIRQLTGHTPEEWIGTRLSEHCEAEAHTKLVGMIERGISSIHGKSGMVYETVILRKDGSPAPVEVHSTIIFDENGIPVGLQGTTRDITERKRSEEKLRKNEELLNATGDLARIGGWEIDLETNSVFWTRTTKAIHEMPENYEPTFNETINFFPPENRPAMIEAIRRAREEGVAFDIEMPFITATGRKLWVCVIGKPESRDGGCVRLHGTIQDISERMTLENQLRQAQKLESIGQLAAGIAHEINTPIQYVGDNTRFLKETFEAVATVLEKYDELFNVVTEGKNPDDCLGAVKKSLEEADLEYLQQEIPLAIKQSLQGLEQVSKIVRSMKDFSHPGTEEKVFVDINTALESTITIARNEWKYVAEMEIDFENSLPLVSCFPGEMNQVFLNLIVNAAHAIADIVGNDGAAKGTITAKTRSIDNGVEILITDTGKGIPGEILPYIFDPFFTTKQVGKGTGQGLALAYSTVVKKHGGSITCRTEVGKGTTFSIQLPL